MRHDLTRLGPRGPRLAAGAGVAVMLGLIGLFSTGCSYIKVAAFLARPETEKVAAEYKDLPGKKVLIYVWAEREIQWEYAKLRLDLSAYLGDYLHKNVKDATVINAIDVERYIEQQRTMDLDPIELGRHFKADVVIHLSVFQFSVRDPEMAHFYRGRLGASVQVYDLTGSAEPERITLRDVKVVVPEEGVIGVANATAAQIRQQTYDVFTVETGKKFHEWSRKLEE